jgi:hypothetical protein
MWPTCTDVRALFFCVCFVRTIVVSPLPILLSIGFVFLFILIYVLQFFFVTCLNKCCLDLWVVDVNNFLAFGLRKMSFDIRFFASGLRNISYLYIELSLFKTYKLLQLKISHSLTDIDIIDQS